MINYWVGVINPLHADVLSYLLSPRDYSGSTSLTDIVTMVSFLEDPDTVFGLFKVAAGRFLYSFYVTPEQEGTYQQLLEDYPSLLVLGGWDMEGTRTVELHPSLINHMPDVSLEDVNLLSGQGSRDFS